MINKISKVGRLRAVFLITLVSIIASVLITTIMLKSFGLGLSLITIAISITAPLLIAPTISWFIISLLLRVHELEKEQRELASKDMLTGLMSRRAFIESCESLVKLSKRNKQSLILAYIDLDNFKQINDTYGHTGGNDVLISFSDVLRKRLRKSDLSGRIGGEEFAIAMSNTGLKQSITVLESIRDSIKKDRVVSSGNTIKYTLSIGVTILDNANNVDLDKLIIQADTALYSAKHSGKDCIIEYKASNAH